MKLSILIKTYNEERNIARCLDAVFKAIEGIEEPVEVIVADSLSSDGTVALASAYPVKVVQLLHTADRGCGSGVQLGFQHAAGEFVYLLDGDMELQGEFLREALGLMATNPALGGVAGVLADKQIVNWFDRNREKNKPSARAGEAEWLAGGGLYRRAALEAAGGFAGNRNLKAYEEAELGLRLASCGWRMVRIGTVAVFHTGHADSTFGLIRRQWRSGRLDAGGVLLRSALGRPWLKRVLRMCLHPLAVLLFWSLFLASLLFASGHVLPLTLLALGAAACLALLLKKRSVVDSALSVVLWHVSAAGLVRGFIRARLHPPGMPIPSQVLNDKVVQFSTD